MPIYGMQIISHLKILCVLGFQAEWAWKISVKARKLPAVAEVMKRWQTLTIKYCVFFAEGRKTKLDMVALAYNHNTGKQRQLDP